MECPNCNLDMNIVFFLSRRKRILAMGDLIHACCLSLGRWRDPPYMAAMCLARPWYMIPSCPK